ncbi:MAG: transposase [Patescibacteria group bacterium]
MNRNIELSIGEYYHVYNRGTDKRIIFKNDKDYYRFLILLYLCNSSLSVDLGDSLRHGSTLSEMLDTEREETLVSIGAYCLMPNHFHLLLKENKENGISLFMQKLTTAYTMYFNKKYDRSGALFQGKFKAKHANTDNYLKYLFSYIHLNPIKLIDKNWTEDGIKDLDKAENYLNNYIFSSYPDYIGEKRKEKCILDIKSFPCYFQSKKEFKSFIKDWLDYKSEFLTDKVGPCQS